MSLFLAGLSVLLLANILVGLRWGRRGPARADHVLSAHLLGTPGVVILLLLAEAAESPALRDVALVLVALAAVAVSALASRPQASEGRAP
jgi:multicomponent Na+:H+ antiporter subunit F